MTGAEAQKRPFTDQRLPKQVMSKPALESSPALSQMGEAPFLPHRRLTIVGWALLTHGPLIPVCEDEVELGFFILLIFLSCIEDFTIILIG